MTGPNEHVDFADLETVGAHMVEQLQRFGAMESVAPGMTLDWGMQIGSRVFALKVRVVRSDEIAS